MLSEKQIQHKLDYVTGEWKKLNPSNDSKDWDVHTGIVFGNMVALLTVLEQVETVE